MTDASLGGDGTWGVIALTSCGELEGVLGAAVGIVLCTGPGAMLPNSGGDPGDGDSGEEMGGSGGGTTVCKPAAFGIAGTRGKENRSLSGGNTGAVAGDVPFPPSTE